MDPAILIYDSTLLPRSQTFIWSQAEAMDRYVPYYFGHRRAQDSLPLPSERTLVLNRWGNAGRALEAAFLLWGLAPTAARDLGRIRPALLHAHFGWAGTSALPFIRRRRLPLVVTYHGFDASLSDQEAARTRAGRLYLRRRTALSREADLVLAVSGFIRDQLLAQGFAPGKVVVHHIGIDTARFQPMPGVEREPIVLFVGRLVEKKGCEHLLRAMARTRAARPETRLVLIGDGPLRSSLATAAREMGINCNLLGWQKPDSVRAWMGRARVLAIPSVRAPGGSAEGLPMVLVEAQAMGLPVVCFDSGGTAEGMQDGRTGYLLRERDSQGMAERIDRLLTDDLLWRSFSERARKLAVGEFDLRRQSTLLEAIYDAVRRE